jgi:hypothetical protein
VLPALPEASWAQKEQERRAQQVQVPVLQAQASMGQRALSTLPAAAVSCPSCCPRSRR